MDTERNLLFGVLTLQSELIDDTQFAAACTPWSTQKQVALPDLFVDRGWITRMHRIELERSLEWNVKRHGGDVRAALAAVASDDVSSSIEALGDPDLQRSLGIAIPPSPAELLTRFAAATCADGQHRVAKRLNVPTETGTRYSLTRLHKQGGLSEVWVAHDSDLNRPVALKKLQPHQAGSPEAARRFVKEAQVTGQLEHPNIVPIYDLVCPPGDQQPFYTMRLLRGQTLRQTISDYHRRRQAGNVDPLELPRLLRAFISVCNAIGYAHSRGVVHRDLKPENVVVGEFGEVIVLDWGLVKLMDQPVTSKEAAADLPMVTNLIAGDATTAGSVMGTPAYMAPEQAQGNLDLIDYRTDIYGLGATLFAILAGRPPHAHDGWANFADRVAFGETPRVRSIDPSVPPALDAICATAMARDRLARYAKASELADDIERYLADEPVSVYPEPWNRRLARWARRHRTWTQAAALVLVAVTVSSTAATLLVNSARQNERRAKGEATERLKQARDAVDTLLTGVSEGLKDVPGAQRVRNQLLQKAMEAYEQFSDERSGDLELQTEAAKAFVRLAEIRRTLGDLEGAEAACRSAESLYDKLTQQNPGEPALRLGLARSRDQLGLALDLLARHKEAETAYRAAIANAEALVTDYPDVVRFPNYRDQLVHSRTGLGIVLVAMDRGGDAERTYRAAVVDGEMLATSHPTVSSFRNNLARSRANLANLLQVLDRPKDAEIEYQAAIADLEFLAKTDPEVTDYHYRLAITRSNFGALLKDLGHSQAAELTYRAAIEAYDSLVHDNPAVPEYRAGLVAACQNHAYLLSAQNNLEQAEAAYQKAYDEGLRLMADQPNTPEYLALVGDIERHFGVFLRDLGSARLAESSRVLNEAVQVYQTLVDRHSDVVQYRENLESSLHQLELTLAQLQGPDKADDGKRLIAEAAPNRDKAQAIRPLRGSDRHRLSDVKIGESELADAAQVYADRERVAVLPFAQAGGDTAMAYSGLGFMEAMLSDLQYVPNYLALHSSEVLAVLADLNAGKSDSSPVDLDQAAQIGRRIGARYVVTGTFAVVADEFQLTARAIDCTSPEIRVLAVAEAARPKDEICSLGDVVLQQILEQLGNLPDPSKVREMTKISTKSVQARREYDSGFALLNGTAGQALGANQELSEKALEHADAAVRSDPNYVRAYILKARCLSNLDRTAEMEACLRAARIKCDPNMVDELTRLELDGDYSMFVEKNFDSAIDRYTKMLEIDPGHIRALWSLAALYAGDYGAADAGLYDKDAAVGYAARLIVAHPKSPMAEFFGNSKTDRPRED